MFGVGENPIFLQRQAEREERRRQRGEAQQEEEDERRGALIIDGLMATPDDEPDGPEPEPAEDDAADAATDGAASKEDMLNALFAEPSFDDVDVDVDAILDRL